MTRRAIIYTRISKDKTGAGLGVDRQEQDCRELAARLGWEVVGHHSDNDISAYSGKPRPGYQALLSDLQERRADAVIVWHTDRLHRRQMELEGYIEVCQPRDIPTETVMAGKFDLATSSGRMIARILGAVAHEEVEHMIERQRAAKLQAAAVKYRVRWTLGTAAERVARAGRCFGAAPRTRLAG
jgi:site-specific DNA recombinase